MYFPTATAKQLSVLPALPQLPPEPTICLRPGPNKLFFCTVTKSSVTLWRIRPPAVIAHLSRSPTSILEHGETINAHWSPDGARIVLQTSGSFLVLISVQYSKDKTTTVYRSPTLSQNTLRHFLPGVGEAVPLTQVSIVLDGVIRIEGGLLSVSPRKTFLHFSTRNPPAVQRVPWPSAREDQHDDIEVDRNQKTELGHDTWMLNDEEMPWLVDSNVVVTEIVYTRNTGVETWITSDGRAYLVQLSGAIPMDGSSSDLAANEGDERQEFTVTQPLTDESSTNLSLRWSGICIHNVELPRWVQKRRAVDPSDVGGNDKFVYEDPRRGVKIAINPRFSLIATGTHGGAVEIINIPSADSVELKPEVLVIPNAYGPQPKGLVRTMEWSSDGYVLAVGWQHGWALWSVGGRCLAWGLGTEDDVETESFQDTFMYGVQDLFWVPGNFEIVALASSSLNDGALFTIPFAKSAVTEQQTPENARYAFLQMDDRVLVYRGADQPDLSVINPESDVWQHVKIPLDYLATNWPIRYSAISTDGRLIAVSGRRGLLHYSTTSGRWKLFDDKVQEQAFMVRGGLLWFHHVLVAAVEISKSYQIRLYSRDLDLSNQNVLHREPLSAPVVTLSLVDNSLLIYSADNTLSHYLIVPTEETIQLMFCASISFNGVIATPGVVRGLSWMIPNAQKQLGNPEVDLAVATVLMMVGGKLVLMRPRKSATQEVKYDMQILHDRIEFCWIHLRGIGTLENSLWGYDGKSIRVWLNALNIESRSAEPHETVQESVNIPLDFYPLSVLMDKGIIIGAEHEIATRSNLSFVLFRYSTSSHLFIHHILLSHLGLKQIQQAVSFAAHYENLVYFVHSLEILLHTVVESEADIYTDNEGIPHSPSHVYEGVLPTVIEFLDYFDAALDVIVGCARKTEVTRWKRLFDIVGNPKTLFETCLSSNLLKTAGSYIPVLHNLEQLEEGNQDVVRLLSRALEAQDWTLCRDLLRFLHSIDDTGTSLRNALSRTRIIDLEDTIQLMGDSVVSEASSRGGHQ